MDAELAIAFDKYKKVRDIRWFNLSFKPAVEKQVSAGKLSRYLADKLLEPYSHLSRKRIPSGLNIPA